MVLLTFNLSQEKFICSLLFWVTFLCYYVSSWVLDQSNESWRTFFYYIFNKLFTHLRQTDELFKKNDSDVTPGRPIWSYGQKLVHLGRPNYKHATQNATQIFLTLKSTCKPAWGSPK